MLNLVSIEIVMKGMYFSLQDCQISTVIVTLGGDALSRTLESINIGSLVLNEILICVTKLWKV